MRQKDVFKLLWDTSCLTSTLIHSLKHFGWFRSQWGWKQKQVLWLSVSSVHTCDLTDSDEDTSHSDRDPRVPNRNVYWSCFVDQVSILHNHNSNALSFSFFWMATPVQSSADHDQVPTIFLHCVPYEMWNITLNCCIIKFSKEDLQQH